VGLGREHSYSTTRTPAIVNSTNTNSVALTPTLTACHATRGAARKSAAQLRKRGLHWAVTHTATRGNI